VVKRHLDQAKTAWRGTANRRLGCDPISVSGGWFQPTVTDVTTSTTAQPGATRSFPIACALPARIVLALMFLICQLHMVPAHANEAVAQELADCQDEEKVAELRQKICTTLIGLAGIDDSLKAEALLNRGMARQDADDLEGAISDYTEAIALNPEYPALYVQRADAYAAMDNVPLAIKDVTRAIELVSDDADHFATRGGLYAETGDVVLAEADYRKALELEADHEQALEGLKTLKK
jgi:tetratricopeptide (TPR) repeat protein